MLAYLVFEIAAIGLLYPLRQVAEEDKCRHGCFLEHGDILDFHIFAFVGWWRIGCDVFLKNSVEFVGGDDALAVVIDLYGCLEHLEYALLCEGRPEDDGEVYKWSEALANSVLKCFDGCLGLILDKVPFVDTYNKAFLIFLDKREDAYVLGLDTACGVNHENAHIGCLDSSYRSYYRVILDILDNFCFFADTGGVDKIKVKSKFIVAGVYIYLIHK